MEKFFSGAKLQIIFHTLAFLPLFCIKQQQNIFLERKRVLIREHKEHANKSQRGRKEGAKRARLMELAQASCPRQVIILRKPLTANKSSACRLP